ncbi:unnamed protein product [Strongylus vulgaris]|uniref:Uncharacterized protein n=1 Tax=Strongylus vulgaris TaxID=40348 RepID=A0A3P7JAC2_STRVU|nr:unnamed protein product [Strongylus vulgaris]
MGRMGERERGEIFAKYVRRRFIQGDTLHDVVRQGLMCLYALAPHTVHEESSLQMVFVHIQTYQGMIDSIAKLRMQDMCPANDTSSCKLRKELISNLEIYRLNQPGVAGSEGAVGRLKKPNSIDCTQLLWLRSR